MIMRKHVVVMSRGLRGNHGRYFVLKVKNTEKSSQAGL